MKPWISTAPSWAWWKSIATTVKRGASPWSSWRRRAMSNQRGPRGTESRCWKSPGTGIPETYDGGRNFGHLAYCVDNIYASCASSLLDRGVTINRPPRDGHMAFIRSPDGISIELLQDGEVICRHRSPGPPWKIQVTGKSAERSRPAMSNSITSRLIVLLTADLGALIIGHRHAGGLPPVPGRNPASACRAESQDTIRAAIIDHGETGWTACRRCHAASWPASWSSGSTARTGLEQMLKDIVENNDDIFGASYRPGPVRTD